MKIKNNTEYRIKKPSEIFRVKYGTATPEIRVEGNWKELTGGSWQDANENPTCMIFGMRLGLEGYEGIPTDEEVYYGKIHSKDGVGLGELVVANELEEM